MEGKGRTVVHPRRASAHPGQDDVVAKAAFLRVNNLGGLSPLVLCAPPYFVRKTPACLPSCLSVHTAGIISVQLPCLAGSRGSAFLRLTAVRTMSGPSKMLFVLRRGHGTILKKCPSQFRIVRDTGSFSRALSK